MRSFCLCKKKKLCNDQYKFHIKNFTNLSNYIKIYMTFIDSFNRTQNFDYKSSKMK